MVPLDFTALERLAPVVVLDADAAVLWFSPAFQELTGRRLDQARGRRFTELVFPDEASRVEDALRRARHGAPAVRLQCRWMLEDGERRTLAFALSTVAQPGDGAASIVLTGTDVTELVAEHDADRVRLQNLLAQAPDGIFVADLEGRYTDVNEAGCRMLGYSRDELVGKTITDLLPPADVERLWASREELMAGRVHVADWRLRRKDGRYLPVEVSAKILPDGRWQGFVRDISLRWEHERKLAETVDDLNRAQAVAKVGSWRLDVTRNELRWSEESYRIFGVPPGTPMTYGTFLDRVHPDDRAYVDRMWTAALRGAPYDIEHRLLVDGVVKWVREKADLDIDESGAARGGIGITLDITEQRRAAEEQLLLQERLSAIISIAADAIISVDDEQRIVLYNGGAEEIFGWSREEMIGQPLDLLIPERLREIHRQHVASFAAEPTGARAMGRAVPALRGLRKNGEEFPAEAAISRVDVGGTKILTVTLRDVSARAAAEEERERLSAQVEAERAQLQTILDLVPVGVLVFQPGGQLYANRRTEELFGVELSASGGSAQYAGRVFHQDGRPVAREELVSTRVLRDGVAVFGEEYLIESADGARVPVLGSAVPMRDESGHVIGGVGVFQDISERMRTEEALRLTEQRLRVSLSAAPVVVFNQDRDLRYTWIHNPTQPIRPEDALGKTEVDLFEPADAERIMAIKRRVLDTGVRAHELVTASFGGEPQTFDLTVEPLRDAHGDVVAITGAGWNVTERRRAEQEQRLLAELGALLMTAAPSYEETLTALAEIGVRELADFIFVDVIDGGEVRRLRVSHADPAKARIAKALQRLRLDRCGPHLAHEPLCERSSTLIADMTAEQLESMAQGPAHLELLRALDIRSLIAVPLLARGRLLGALALVSSTRSRRYGPHDLAFAEQIARIAALAVDNAQLYRSARRAIAAREEILGIVAHDLRTPLGIVTMQADLLVRRGGPERRSQRPVETIRRAAQRMNRLIQDMLDVARLESGSLRILRARVDTHAVVDEAIEGHRESAARLGLSLRTTIDEALPDVLVDRDRLLQVLDNLIGNAEKFTPPGGAIELGARSRGGEVLFWVADTGRGIPQELLPRLFERFWQAAETDRRGAGLGLFIVKGLVEAHGGQVCVDSAVGRGTTFWFTMPVAPSADALASPPP